VAAAAVALIWSSAKRTAPGVHRAGDAAAALAELHVVGEQRFGEPLARQAGGVKTGRPDRAARLVGLRWKRQHHLVARGERSRRRAVGGEGHVDQVRRNLAPRLARVAGNLDQRLGGDERVLERLAVGGVREVDIAAAQRLQRAGRCVGGRDARMVLQLDRLDAVLVLTEVGEGAVGFDRLPAARDAHEPLEADVFFLARERGHAGRDVGAVPPVLFRRDVHDGLIEDGHDVERLVPRHADAVALDARARERHRPRRAHHLVAVGVGGVLGERRHAVGSHQAHGAIERNRRAVLAETAFLGGDGERPLAVALVGHHGDAGHPAGAVGVGELLLVGDADVFTLALEAHGLAAGDFDHGAGVGPRHRRRGGRRLARPELARDDHGEYHGEDGDEGAGLTLPAGHYINEISEGRLQNADLIADCGSPRADSIEPFNLQSI
jgi:hypothetical protein